MDSSLMETEPLTQSLIMSMISYQMT